MYLIAYLFKKTFLKKESIELTFQNLTFEKITHITSKQLIILSIHSDTFLL